MLARTELTLAAPLDDEVWSGRSRSRDACSPARTAVGGTLAGRWLGTIPASRVSSAIPSDEASSSWPASLLLGTTTRSTPHRVLGSCFDAAKRECERPGERPERRARGVLEHLQAQAPGAGAPDLDGDADLLPRWRPPLRPSFQARGRTPRPRLGPRAARAPGRPSLGAAWARSATPSRSATARAGAEAPWPRSRMVRGDEVRRPEPCAQRRARRVQHGPGRHRGLLPAALALPDKPAAMHLAGLAPAIRATDGPLRPARREQVGSPPRSRSAPKTP